MTAMRKKTAKARKAGQMKRGAKRTKKSTHPRKRPAVTRAYGTGGAAFTVVYATTPVPVVVTRSVAGEAQLRAKLNDRNLLFNNGVAHATVAKGQTNTLDWEVLGPPGAAYSIEVTQPSGMDCGESNVVLGPSGKGGGSCDFST